MTSIHITLRGAQISAQLDGLLTTGMAGAPVTFTYDEAWDGMEKMAVFRAGDLTLCARDLQDSTTVPTQILEKTGCTLQISVYGIDENGRLRLPSCWCSIDQIHPGADPEATESCDPSLPVWKQAMDLATETADLVGNIEKAIDHILHLQEELLGGEAA